jgi:hypothetical protein
MRWWLRRCTAAYAPAAQNQAQITTIQSAMNAAGC